jgi:hypothetical protein
MRRFSVLCGIVCLIAGGPAAAADFDGVVGGIHAGSVGSIHLGYLMFDPDNVDVDDPNWPVAGARWSHSRPLSADTSVQFDIAAEFPLERQGDDDQTMFELVAAGHWSRRDPSTRLWGFFGGVGFVLDDGDNGDGTSVAMPFLLAGLEKQLYLGDTTLYGQAGYMHGKDNWLETIENGLFARVVASHYFSPNTKVSGELSFVHGGRPNNDPTSGGIVNILGWGARLDHVPAGQSFGVSLIYNGFDYQTTEESDAPWVHEVRLALVKYFGSGTILENDRHAAGLDLPPVSRWFATSNNEIE